MGNNIPLLTIPLVFLANASVPAVDFFTAISQGGVAALAVFVIWWFMKKSHTDNLQVKDELSRLTRTITKQVVRQEQANRVALLDIINSSHNQVVVKQAQNMLSELDLQTPADTPTHPPFIGEKGET